MVDGEGGLAGLGQDGEGGGLVSYCFDSCTSCTRSASGRRRPVKVHQVGLVDPAHEIGGDLGRPFDVVVGILDVGADRGVIVVLNLERHASTLPVDSVFCVSSGARPQLRRIL